MDLWAENPSSAMVCWCRLSRAVEAPVRGADRCVAALEAHITLANDCQIVAGRWPSGGAARSRCEERAQEGQEQATKRSN